MSWLFLKQVYSIAIRVTLHGRTTSYQIVFLTETNYRNKTMFLRFAFNNLFYLLMSKDFLDHLIVAFYCVWQKTRGKNH